MRKLITYLILALLANCKQPDLSYSFASQVDNQSILKAFCKLITDKKYASIGNIEFSQAQLNNFTFLKIYDKNFSTLNDNGCEPIPTSVMEYTLQKNFQPADCEEQQVFSYDNNGLVIFSKRINVTVAESNSREETIVLTFFNGAPQEGTYDLSASNVVSGAIVKCPGCNGANCYCTYFPLMGMLTITRVNGLTFQYGETGQSIFFKAGCCSI